MSKYRRDGTAYPDTQAGLFAWCKDFENMDLRRIEETILWWGGRISTVWLGLDHSFGGREPLIFETMLFPSNDMDRYSTEKEATEGHKRFVKKYRWRFWYKWRSE